MRKTRNATTDGTDNTDKESIRAVCVIMVFLTAALVGCGNERSSFERFIPDEEKAKSALQVALDSWKNGDPPGKIETADYSVQVADSQRRQGQRLREFQILGEAPADAACCYAVRLSLANPTQELTARFVVIGLEPVWVMRHEDYMMTLHWDMKMMQDQKTAARN